MSEIMGQLNEAVAKVNAVKKDAIVPNVVGARDEVEFKAVNVNRVLRLNEAKILEKDIAGKVVEVSVTQLPTSDDLVKRFTEVSRDISTEANLKAESAVEQWNKLAEKSKELGGNTQVEGIVIAEKTISAHTEAKLGRQVLANNIIDNLQENGFKGATAKLIDLSVESYILDMPVDVRGNLTAKNVTVDMLKNDPRFEQYRNDIVNRVQKHGAETRKSAWKGITTALRFGFNAKGYHDFVELMGQGRDLSIVENNLKTLPPRESANQYLSEFGSFVADAQMVVDNKAMLDALPIVQAETIADHKKRLQKNMDRAIEYIDGDEFNIFDFNNAHNENETLRLHSKIEKSAESKATNAEAALDKAQREAGKRIGAEIAEERGNKAREELSDVELQAIKLKELSSKHFDLASQGLAALAELQYSEAAIAKFKKAIEEGNLPEELQGLINGDVGASVDEFIKSNGKKGSVDAIRQLIGGANNMGALEKIATDPSRDGFLTLNTLQESFNGEARTVETGIVAVDAQDGTWQFRFATKKDGKIEVSQDVPVINIKPESVFAAMSIVDNQELSLKTAQEKLGAAQKTLGNAELFKKTLPKDDLAKHRRAVKIAQEQVVSLEASLAKSKSELAQELRTTNTDKTLGSAFAEMSKAQQQVAEEFYSSDFREMVKDLSAELNMQPDKVTAEVLTTMVVESMHASEQADALAEFLSTAKVPGALEAKVLAGRKEVIDELAAEYAVLLDQRRQAEGILPELRSDFDRKVAKSEKTLNAKIAELGNIVNNDFIEAIPAPLRKGAQAVSLSDSKFASQVKSVLEDAGFDAEKFGKTKTAAALRVRSTLPYSEEVKGLVFTATKALVDIDNAPQTDTLRKALTGGNAEEFFDAVKKVQEQATTEKFGAMVAKANEVKLKELLSTPEGIAAALETGELTIEGAIEKIVSGEVEVANVMEALNTKLEVTKDEAARRMSLEISKIDKWDPASDPDPLAGRPDVVAMAQFIQRQPLGQNASSYWRGIIERAKVEKKTNPSA